MECQNLYSMDNCRRYMVHQLATRSHGSRDVEHYHRGHLVNRCHRHHFQRLAAVMWQLAQHSADSQRHLAACPVQFLHRTIILSTTVTCLSFASCMHCDTNSKNHVFICGRYLVQIMFAAKLGQRKTGYASMCSTAAVVAKRQSE